ncbi:hypothetical protein ACFRAI_38125 [Streptomyces sp. NPDC056637]|uniref:hypothetical protein n=1 Tax=unclassified Streptomyces TaxID=2593676 RepID=UPI0036B0FF02
MQQRSKRQPPPAQRTLNDAAQLADQLQQAGYTKRDIAQIIDRDPSLVSQFYTKNKGAAFVPALRSVLTAVTTGGITEIPELAACHITRCTTVSGTQARVRTKAVLITPPAPAPAPAVSPPRHSPPALPACAL